MFTIQSMIIYLCILKLYHARPCVHARLCILFLNFAVKYVGKQHAEHLLNALLRTYELTTDWTATVYSGMTLKWDYDQRTCDISMPGYVSKVLSKFQHDAPKHPQHTPSRYVTPVYGAKTQYATRYDTPPLTAQQCLTIQKDRIRFVLRPRS
jgi:hypothetical protein